MIETEKEMAEMLATLYDASLDVFKKNSWGLNVLNYSRSSRNWKSNISFSTARSELMSENWNKYFKLTFMILSLFLQYSHPIPTLRAKRYCTYSAT